MCYFESTPFQAYKELTRLHHDYYQEGETDQAYHERILAKRRTQNAVNRELNKQGKVANYEEIVKACHEHEQAMRDAEDRKKLRRKRKERKEQPQPQEERPQEEQPQEEQPQEEEQKAA